MNQLYRALHMPPARLFKKLTGSREIYTVAVRRRPAEQALPALDAGVFTPLPYAADTWYADPLLCSHAGKKVLFCEAFDRAAHKGRIVAFDFDAAGLPVNPRTVLEESYHLSFPLTFVWNGALFMLPETGANHSLNLYRCTDFPEKWELAQSFAVGCELCDAVVWEQTPTALTLLCSETRPENQLFVRWRRYTLRREGGGFALAADEDFNAAHAAFDLTSRNAGPLFELGGQRIHPTQVSTRVDYGVYLQFLAQRAGAEVPMCAAQPAAVRIAGLAPGDIVGIHTYCCDEELEVIDARYLHRG